MSEYHDFTSQRSTLPDAMSLIDTLRTNVDPSCGCYFQHANGPYRVKKLTAFSSVDLNACQTAIDTAPIASPQLTAQHYIDRMPVFEKALLLTLLDQINVLRTRAGLATVTPAQAIQAVRDKAGTL